MTVVKLPGVPDAVAIRNESPDCPSRRWSVYVACNDCDAVFMCAAPAWQVHSQLVNGQLHKMFLAGTPLVCPHCKNLKPAEGR